MDDLLISSFAVRLRDVLGTLETVALLGASETRVRGLGEQLQFACLALPCDEALVALELGALGRLVVPGVATAEEWTATNHQFLPSGTPFAFLLGGGTGFATEVESEDAVFTALEDTLATTPRYAMFVPVRVGAAILGGVALFRTERSFGDVELTMGERLGEVLSLTVENYRTEQVLLSLFATVLPDLCKHDAPTKFADGLEKYVHGLRMSPDYRRRLHLAGTVGRIAAAGPAETRLVDDVLGRMEAYLTELTSGQEQASNDESADLLTDELYE